MREPRCRLPLAVGPVLGSVAAGLGVTLECSGGGEVAEGIHGGDILSGR